MTHAESIAHMLSVLAPSTASSGQIVLRPRPGESNTAAAPDHEPPEPRRNTLAKAIGKPHQGTREAARRRRQMERNARKNPMANQCSYPQCRCGEPWDCPLFGALGTVDEHTSVATVEETAAIEEAIKS
jgi:hypothetical protein